MNTQIFVITHVPLASALKEVVLHVFPDAKGLHVYDILPSDAPEVIQTKIKQDIQQSQAQNILIFTDLIGATPANIGMRVAQTLDPQHSVFFGGVNVCMLLNAVRYGDLTIDALKAKILEGGQKGMQSLDCSCITS